MDLLNRDNDVPKLGETQDQFYRRTGKGFFMQMPKSFDEHPLTQSWQGDIIYWENEVKKAQVMLTKAKEKAEASKRHSIL